LRLAGRGLGYRGQTENAHYHFMLKGGQTCSAISGKGGGGVLIWKGGN